MKISISNFWAFIILVISVYLVWVFKTILIFLVISGIVTLLLKPLVKLLRKIRIGKFRIPSWLGALLSIFALIGFIVWMFIFIIPLILDEAKTIYTINPQHIISFFSIPISQFESFLKEYSLVADPENFVHRNFQERILGMIDITSITGVFNIFIGITIDVVVGIFAVFFISFFFLKDRKLFSSIVAGLTPDKHTRSAIRTIHGLEHLLTRYFVGLIIQIILIAILSSSGLAIIGVKNPILIGVIAGITNVVPYLGPIIGIIVGVTFGVLGNLEMGFYTELFPMIVKILIVFLIVQQIDNNVFQPIIYSTSVKAHPLEIFLVILISARIAGIAGMIIAIPAYTAIRVIAKEFLTEFKLVRKLTEDL